MARRRYISTNISVDPAVNLLAEKYNDFAALLYTWMIPHAEDDTTITGDPEKLILMVIPGLRSKTIEDVISALEAMAKEQLIIWDKENSVIYFPAESFYKYQTYIKNDKRMSAEQQPTPTNTAKRRKTPKNTASPSLSPSLSLSPSPIKDMSIFESFWEIYPRKEGKADAEKAWTARLKNGITTEQIIQATRAYVAKCKEENTNKRYIKMAKTFLGPSDHIKEYLATVTEPELVGWDPDNLPRHVRRTMELAKNAEAAK